jgi:hypothetical protein
VVVGDVAHILEAHAASIFRVEFSYSLMLQPQISTPFTSYEIDFGLNKFYNYFGI